MAKSATLTVSSRAIPLVRAADRLALAVAHADEALLEDKIRDAARDYLALRQEWSRGRS